MGVPGPTARPGTDVLFLSRSEGRLIDDRKRTPARPGLKGRKAEGPPGLLRAALPSSGRSSTSGPGNPLDQTVSMPPASPPALEPWMWGQAPERPALPQGGHAG